MKRQLLIIALVSALTSAASAQSVLAPPAEFLYVPDKPYEISFVSQVTVNEMCKMPVLLARIAGRPNANAQGCTDLRSRKVLIVRDLPPEVLVEVIRHEIAHLNGWMHD